MGNILSVKRIFQKKNNNSQEQIVFVADNTPKELSNIVSDLISMRGILRLDVIQKSGKTLYSYNRWGKLAKTLEENESLSIINSIKKKLSKIDKKQVNQIIIRADDVNFIAFSTLKIIAILQCDKKAKLPMVTIKTKRIATKITEMI